jgi:G3E family GTPase
VQLTPVIILAGAGGSAEALLERFARDPVTARIPVVRDTATQATAGCACCALADGLTRTLRELHAARRASGGVEAIVVDATGIDPRPAIAALSRVPLTSLRMALSDIFATGSGDALATALADVVVDPMRVAPAGLLAGGLYAGGRLHATGWLERGSPDRILWSRPEPCRLEDVESAVQALQLHAGERLHRVKGLVDVAGEGPRLIQLFGHTRYPSARLPEWPSAIRGSRFAIAADPLEAAAIARILGSIPIPPT